MKKSKPELTLETLLNEGYNLDAMEPAELRELAENLGVIQRQVERLKYYCRYKAEAIESRLAGKIQLAQNREQECQHLYSRLWDRFKWQEINRLIEIGL